MNPQRANGRFGCGWQTLVSLLLAVLPGKMESTARNTGQHLDLLFPLSMLRNRPDL